MALAPGLNRKRGLFGASTQVPQQPAMTATANPMAPAKPKFFGDGGVGRAIAGNIGDFLLQYSGMQPIYAPAMAQQQHYRQQEANRLREFANQKALIDYRKQNPEPDYFDDNAGNRWSVNPATGERKLIFRDPNAKRIPQKVTGQNGEEYIEWIEIPNNVNDDGTFRTPQAGPAVGAIEDGFRFKGGNPADPNSWEPADNSPPPISSAPSRQNTISRTAYQAWVNQYGREEADSIMRRNGFTVGNY